MAGSGRASRPAARRATSRADGASRVRQRGLGDAAHAEHQGEVWCDQVGLRIVRCAAGVDAGPDRVWPVGKGDHVAKPFGLGIGSGGCSGVDRS